MTIHSANSKRQNAQNCFKRENRMQFIIFTFKNMKEIVQRVVTQMALMLLEFYFTRNYSIRKIY